VFLKFDGVIIELAMRLEQLRRHSRITSDSGSFCKPLVLDTARSEHPLADGGGGFPGMCAGKVFKMDSRDFHSKRCM